MTSKPHKISASGTSAVVDVAEITAPVSEPVIEVVRSGEEVGDGGGDDGSKGAR